MSSTVTVDTSAAALEALNTPPVETPVVPVDDVPAEGTPAEPVKPEGVTIPEDKPADEDADAEIKNVLESAGLSWDTVTDEYNDAGDLGEETRAKLTKAGFPKAMVDTYLEGIRSDTAKYNGAVYSAAGSEEQYASATAWAKENLDAAAKTAFNNAVTSGDLETAKLAVEGLMARYAAKSPKAPVLVNGKPGGNANAKAFASQNEVTQAMRNPLYKSSPAYREQVKERLAISPTF